MGHVNYYAWLNSEYREKRDFLVKALQGAGFETPDYSRTAGGGFFIMAGITPSVEERVPKGRVGEVNESAPTGKVRLDWAICEVRMDKNEECTATMMLRYMPSL